VTNTKIISLKCKEYYNTEKSESLNRLVQHILTMVHVIILDFYNIGQLLSYSDDQNNLIVGEQHSSVLSMEGFFSHLSQGSSEVLFTKESSLMVR
jgi:hypothetical protein